MLNKYISYFGDLFIFIIVFSFFNDNYMVETFGENILKILFVAFVFIFSKRILINFGKMTLLQDQLFFVFYLSLIIMFLVHILLNRQDNFITNALSLITILAIVIYFGRFPLTKLLYFVWVSMVISVVICFFNEPISSWTFRTTGGTGDPNEFATQLLMFLFASIYLFSLNRSKLFLSISMLFFLYGFFKAGSLSAFLVLGITIFLYVLGRFRTYVKSILNYKSAILLAGILMIFIFVDFSKVIAVSNMLNRTKHTVSADSRFNNLIAGLHMVENNPIIGVGVNNYADNTRKYAEIYLHNDAIAPHNVYLKLAAESGLFVFILFMFLIVVLLFKNFKIIQSSNYFNLWLSTVAVLLMGLSLGITYDKYFWLMIVIYMQVNSFLKERNMKA